MVYGPVVPDHQIALGPGVAIDVLGLLEMTEQVVQDRAAFLAGKLVDPAGEARIDIKRLGPRFRMGADHRMDHGRHLGLFFVGQGRAVRDVLEEGVVGVGVVVDGGQRIEKCLHGVRQVFVGLAHVHEHGIAAVAGDFLGMQQRCLRRLVHIGQVRMPILPGIDGADGLALVLDVGDVEDFRVVLVVELVVKLVVELVVELVFELVVKLVVGYLVKLEFVFLLLQLDLSKQLVWHHLC